MELGNVKKERSGKDNQSRSKDISVEPGAFTESGKCDDEITFVFDDNNKLYASKNFLRYASPVFEAMFTSGWKEGKESCVKLKGKEYDDFLEFLNCIHPRIFKPITERNVLQIVAIADEYQVTSIITRCKTSMTTWLNDSFQRAIPNRNLYLNQAVYLRPCLQIAAKAHELSYNDVVDTAIKTIAKYGHILYNASKKEERSGFYVGEPFPEIKMGDETLGEIKEECMNIFNDLPIEIKYKILSERLFCLDNEKSKLMTK